MKLIISFSLLLLLFTACSDKSSPEKPQQKEGPSSGEIINKYVDTLTTAQDKAKQAAGTANSRTEAETRAAQEMEKQ